MDRASKVQEVVISHVQDHDTWHIGNFVIELPGPLTLHGAMALIALGILALFFIFLFDKKAKDTKSLSVLDDVNLDENKREYLEGSMVSGWVSAIMPTASRAKLW